MDGIKFSYKNNKNATIEITHNKSQYIILEPKGRKIVRYYLTKDGIDVEATNLLQDTVEPDVVEVKIRPTKDIFISRLVDFDNIDSFPKEEFPIDFNGKNDLYFDVLYTNKLDEGIRLKVSTISENLDTFETEFTVTDKPDEFVKIVDLIIRRERVEATYVHRRSGRLKMSPTLISYEELGSIWNSRLVSFNHIDKDLLVSLPRRELFKAGWFIDSAKEIIYREKNKRKVQITNGELGAFISKYATPLEILNLLHTTDFNKSQHPIIKRTANNLQDCNRSCSLLPVDSKTVIDTRK